MRSGGKKTTVVRVDFGKTVFAGTAKMEGVGATKEHAGRQGAKDLRDRGSETFIDGNPVPQPRLAVVAKLFGDLGILQRGKRTLSKFTMKGRGGFCSPEDATPYRLGAGQNSHLFPSRVFEVATCDVGSIEILHRPSLSSEMSWVTSTLGEREPSWPIRRANPGRSFRFSKVSAERATHGSNRTTGWPLAEMRTGSRRAASTQEAVCSCSSATEIVFMAGICRIRRFFTNPFSRISSLPPLSRGVGSAPLFHRHRRLHCAATRLGGGKLGNRGLKQKVIL